MDVQLLLKRISRNFVLHISLSVLASLILYISNPDRYETLSNSIDWLWPLLLRSKGYMFDHGLGDQYNYMVAIYFKDALLLFIFGALDFRLLRNEKLTFSLKKNSHLLWAYGVLMACILISVTLFVTGPIHIPSTGRFANTVFVGGLFSGLFLYTWLLPWMLLFVFLLSAVQFFRRRD